MNKPSSRDAWIGVVGVIGGAVVAGLFSLIPWYYSEPDPIVELRRTVQAGIEGLFEIDAPDHRLRQIERLEALLATDPAIHYQGVVRTYRDLTETQLASIEAAREQRETLTAQHLATGTESGSETTVEMMLAAASSAEAEQIAAATKVAQETAQALAARDADELARQAETRAELQRDLAQERVCQDDDCTTWILR